MAVHLGTQLHYRCVFDVAAPTAATAIWTDLAKSIRAWIAGKEVTNEAFFSRWFFAGGEWKPPGQPRVFVKTERFVGDGAETAPQFWSIRYEHPCSDVPFRQWRTDIGIGAAGDGRYRLSLVTAHWLLDDYSLARAEGPLPSAPRVVTNLVSSQAWTAVAGSEQLRARPSPVRVGAGNVLVARITDPQRLCPLIYVSRENDTDAPRVDAARLARLLAGTAVVYEAASRELNDELSWLLPSEFQCRGGMVRVYQPNVHVERAGDFRRHRFFTRDAIGERGAEQVENQIIEAITRRVGAAISDAVTTVEDVIAKQREARLAELRPTTVDDSTREWIGLLEADNARLIEENKAVKGQIEQLNDRVELVEVEKAEITDQLSDAKTRQQQEMQLRFQAESRVRALERQRDFAGAFKSLPESLPAIIELIERIHPDQIAFTERAKKSAEDARINEERGEMFEAWRCLWAVATDLHDLCFGDDGKPGRLIDTFRSRTGFDIALTETKQTKRDNKLMALRKDAFNGEEIDITPHVKYGNKEPKCLRVHFHAYRNGDRRLIVVGHCGDHLDTYGTQRRR